VRGRELDHGSQSRFQAIKIFFIRGHANRSQLNTERSSCESDAPGKPGATAFVGERHGHAEVWQREVIVDDALDRRDLDEDAVVRVVGAVRSMEGERPLATRLEIELPERAGEAVGTKPARELPRIAEGREQSFLRDGKEPGANHLGVHGKTVIIQPMPNLSCNMPKRDDQKVLPRSAGHDNAGALGS